MKKFFIMFLISIFGLFSFFSYAEDALDDVLGIDSEAGDYQIVNEELNNTQVQDTVSTTAKLMLKISVVIGIAVFLFGGIRFMMSMGDDAKAKKVRDGLITAGIGLIIAFGAWVILQLIISTGTDLQVGNEIDL